MKKTNLFAFCLIVGMLLTSICTGIAFAGKEQTSKSGAKTSPPEDKKFFIPIKHDDPASVITAYFKLSALNRIQEATTLLGPIYNIDTIGKITQEMKVFSKMVQNQQMDVNLLEVKQQGDWALAVLLVQNIGNKGEKKRSLSDQYLIRLKNQWRVVPAAIRQDPGFSPFIEGDAVAMFEFWSKNQAAYEAKYLKKK